MRRAACVYLPHWAMQNWCRRRGDDTPPEAEPFALTAEATHGPVLHALNGAAREARVRPGQRVTDARAICPALRVFPSEPEADARALHDLALWATRWGPWASTEGVDGLWLDLTGVQHLWSGEAALAAEMLERLAALGFSAQLGIAPTPGAAWALAHYGRARIARVEPDELEARLAPLPVDSLRLAPDVILLLGRLGLRRLGDLMAVPRLPLARRFTDPTPSANPLIRLDQALGRLHEPITPTEADPPPRVVRRLTEPVQDVSVVEALLAAMADALCRELEERGLGARRLRFDGFRTDGGVVGAAAETARPVRDPRHLLRLLDGRLETLDAGFGFDALALTVERHEPLGAQATDLLADGPPPDALPRLLDRLVGKIGRARVRRPVAVESHVPERSLAWVDALGDVPARPSPPARVRPVRLLDRPEEIAVLYATPEGAPRRFTWRKQAHAVAKVEGPERIAPEWWRERSTARARDYYRVEDEAGRRYWIYRDGLVGDGRGDPPRWYLHGLFA